MTDLKDKSNEIVISCLPGLVETLKQELNDHNFPVVKESPMSVTTQGALLDTYFLNLWLRTGSHVYFKLKTFKANNTDELYKAVYSMPWEEYFSSEKYFSIHSFVKHPDVNDTRFPNLRVKDGIADRFMKVLNTRPSSGSDKDQVVIYLQWVGEDATIYLDTSGITLSKRGYRLQAAEAPLSETLAAALVMTSEWDKTMPFLNPMCGSGTIAIEAALIAYGIPPGIYRMNFGFKHLLSFDNVHWNKLINEAPKRDLLEPKVEIHLSDISRLTVTVASKNAERAGIEHLLTFSSGDFERVKKSDEPGVIMMNPPYGKRLGEIGELKKMYQRIGDYLKNECSGYIAFIFTGNMELAKFIGLRTSAKKTFYNAKIECKLLKFEMYQGSKKIKSE